MEAKKQITISEILSCLDAGMDRSAMASHFGIPKAELARHFRHPKLKGKRPKAKMVSTLVDDTVEEPAEEPVEAPVGYGPQAPYVAPWGSFRAAVNRD